MASLFTVDSSKLEPEPLIKEVVIDAVAAMRIIKHATNSLPTMVAGSLLGLDVDGVLEITYSFPFPLPKSDKDEDADDDIDGAEYQIEMMKMLRDVNIDNNCVGWYQSMYMGTIATSDVVTYQYSYQSSEELSRNSVLIMYDPILSKKGDLTLKAFRLNEKYMELRKNKTNAFIKPKDILEELPLRIRSTDYSTAFVRCVRDSHENELDCQFEPLSMNNFETRTEKHVELISSLVEDLINEQQKTLGYVKSTNKLRQEHMRWLAKRLQENKELKEAGEQPKSIRMDDSGLKPLPEAPVRIDHLLTVAQLDRYCQQLDEHAGVSFEKLALLSQLNSFN